MNLPSPLSPACLDDLFSKAHHDLKGPVRRIQQSIDFIQQDLGDDISETSTRFMEIITSQTDFMGELIDILQIYATLCTAQPPFTEIPTETALEYALNALSEDITARKAKITHTPLPTLTCAPQMLQTLFYHLIQNALLFSAPETTPDIHVAAKQQDDLWHFTVTDNGIGLPENQLQNIFKPLTKLHPVHEFPGCGMGLAIADMIVQKHGGQITATSQDMHGSCFSFTLQPA